MIYYFDIHRTKVLGPMFRKSGVIQKNPIRGLLGMLALHGKYIYRLPSFLFYPRPVFKNGDDKIIVFDTYSSRRLLEWLCDTQKDKRIIYWCWNSLKRDSLRGWVPKGVELWSFSKYDCDKYDLRYNTQFFFDCLVREAAECRKHGLSQHPRALFVGRDKDRLSTLEELRETLEKEGVEVDLRITRRFQGRLGFYREKLIPYRKVIDLVKKSDILLDYSTNPETGLSLRAMEALFFGKKLITNNLEILESDFYHPANIYVLDHDKRSLREFIDCPLDPVDSEIRDKYLLSNWLKRFD